MVGSDAATTWMSRIAMNMPTHIRTKPNQVAIRAWVVLQTAVVLVALLGTDFGMSGDRNNRATRNDDGGQKPTGQ